MKPWQKIKEQTVYQGFRNIIRKTFKLPHGQAVDFDIIDVPSFVCIAALTKDEKVILVKQYRPGPERDMLSFPEGRVDPGEDNLSAVKRELLEETGYEAAQISFLKSIPQAYANQTKYIYLATGCIKTQEQDLDEHEFIEVICMSIEDFRNLLKNPKEDDCNSVDAGYLLLDLLGYL